MIYRNSIVNQKIDLPGELRQYVVICSVAGEKIRRITTRRRNAIINVRLRVVKHITTICRNF